ncbi:MAG: histidine phosphotransferase family protein [Pseudomonadota bacterium]
MEFQIDMRVLELVASRLCHDVVGPVGAVNNGMEMLEDEDFDMADEALGLVADSARQAARSLQFYRMAYGMAGSRGGLGISEIRELADGLLANTKAKMDWDPNLTLEGAPDGLGKLLLNMIALAEETLPRGGRLSLALAPQGGGFAARVTAEGLGCALRPESEIGLVDDVAIEDLTPRNVHGFFTRLVARRLGGDVTVEPGEGESIAVVARL